MTTTGGNGAIDLDETIPDEAALISYFEAACRPEGPWLVGVERELLPVRRETCRVVSYGGNQGVAALLERVAEQHGYERLTEKGALLGLKKGELFVSLEPGAQVEVSTRPFVRLDEVEADCQKAFGEIRACAAELGIALLGLGLHPFSTEEEITLLPKVRYDIMEEYFDRYGGSDYSLMMQLSASVQTSFDYRSLEDAADLIRTGMLLAPISTAIFANSSFSGGALNGFRSRRAYAWRRTDDRRCGLVPAAVAEGFTLEDWCQHVLDIPMMFAFEDGGLVHAEGASFREFLRNGRNGRRPTWRDWELHLSGVFTEVRIKRVVEIRPADGQPPRTRMAVPAFWTGILYDLDARRQARDLVSHLTYEQLQEAMDVAAREGLSGRVAGLRLGDVARECLHLARTGLEHQGQPVHYLDEIAALVDEGRSTVDLFPWADDPTPQAVVAHAALEH